jgi:endonuclease/exonuclease/phosphatase family metal-dependent hydrolase
MKIISLNIGIKLNNVKKIISFLDRENADIICLQEVSRALDKNVKKQFHAKQDLDSPLVKKYPYRFFGKLWKSRGFNATGKVELDFRGLIEQGNYILSKYPFSFTHNKFYYKEYKEIIDWSKWFDEDHGRAFQHAIVDISNNKQIQLINLHGIWTDDKLGDKRTVEQIKIILKEIKKIIGLPTIIIGDINLLPESESIQLLNKHFTNLIDKYNIMSTRPQLMKGFDKGELVVDYAFVNGLIDIKKFEVPNIDISDHLPLVLEFEI